MAGLPTRQILSPSHLKAYLESDSCRKLLKFLGKLCIAIIDKTNHPNAVSAEARLTSKGDQKKETDSSSLPPVIQVLEKCIDDLSDLIEQYPPEKQPQRFGNKAFRSWHNHLTQPSKSDAAVSFAEQMMTSLIKIAGDTVTATDVTGCARELAAYFLESFGNPLRIDYGTGHEAFFIMFLYCCFKAGVLRDDRATLEPVGTLVVPKYLTLVRKLQIRYGLEPAGSHGMWSIDDYHLLPFVLGSAQLLNHKYIRPRSVLNPDITECYGGKYMYLSAIQQIKRVKTGASFSKTSPMLAAIAKAAKWRLVHDSMCQVFQHEVLGKFPVAQHFLFGSLMPFSCAVAPAPALPSTDSRSDAIAAAAHASASSVSSVTGAMGVMGACPTGVAPWAFKSAGGPPKLDLLSRYFGYLPSNAGKARAMQSSSLANSLRTQPTVHVQHTLLPNREGIVIGGWKITSKKSPLSNEAQLDAISEKTSVPPPEQVFGGNTVDFVHESSGVHISLNTVDALAGCSLLDGRGAGRAPQLRRKVVLPVAEKWKNRLDPDGNEIKPHGEGEFDWTYTSDYYDTLRCKPGPAFTPDPTARINFAKLRRKDPILWFDEVLLYATELDDNGDGELVVKVRVMPECFFARMRWFLRVDRVLVRACDMRLYHDFATSTVVRVSSLRQDSWANLKARGLPVDPRQWTDANQADKLTLLSESTTVVNIK